MNAYGFGTMLMGFTRPDAEGWCHATRWIAAAHLPLWPLRRQRLKPLGLVSTREVTELAYLPGRATRLVLREIAFVLVTRWLVFPALGVGPLAALIAVRCEPSLVTCALYVAYLSALIWLTYRTNRKRLFRKRSLLDPDPAIPDPPPRGMEIETSIDGVH